MSASLSRPDPTSPVSVAEAGFTSTRRGFNQDEVRAFLTSVAAELRRLQERERQLEAELRAARNAAPGEVELDEDTVTAMLGEETLRVLQTARESASQIKIRAEENAARALRDAHDAANRLRQEAEVDAARRRHDAQSDAEAEVALAKQQGREMVNEARAYRERVLADLERRTKLARQHIEELAHVRNRLLQVFERARLVAVDVTSELQAIAGPDEYVSLAATTGPVPLMVPASELDAPVDAGSATETDGGFEAAVGGASPDDTPFDHATEHDAADVDVDVNLGLDVGAAETVHDGRADEDDHDDDVDPAGADGVEAALDGGSVPDDTLPDGIDASGDGPDDPDRDLNDGESESTSEPSPLPPPPVGRDHNVVALFRDRAVDATDEAGFEPPAGSVAKPDVDGLFARLRNEHGEHIAPPDAVAGAPTATGPDADTAPASTAFTRRDEAIVPLIVTGARKLKRILADEQNGALDTLRRKDPVTSLDLIVPDVDAHVAVYVDAILDELTAAAAAGAAELGAKDTKTLRRTLDKAGALDAARALIRSDLVGPLRDRLERSVLDGAGDNEDITRQVRAVYREWKTQRIDDQLDDVFRFAFGGGLTVTAEPGSPMIWTLDPSQPACADCEDNSLAGPVAAGESFPTGHAGAPAHPGCRCLSLPARQ